MVESIEAKVVAILSSILKRDLDPGTQITRENTDGWDSLKHVELLFAIEDEFEVEFDEHEQGELDSVPKIVALLRAKHAP